MFLGVHCYGVKVIFFPLTPFFSLFWYASALGNALSGDPRKDYQHQNGNAQKCRCNKK